MIRTPPQPFDPSRQVRFRDLLVVARKVWLSDALTEALSRVDPALLRTQLGEYIPIDVQRTLAMAGIRDEQIFPVPTLLEAQPSLVGYYRLFLGIPQKSFYKSGTGMSQFRRMEAGRKVTPEQAAALPDFCLAMGASLADMVRQISPAITLRDVAELPLLILGSQFQGGANNTIGQVASKGVFIAISNLLKSYVVEQDDTQIRVTTPSNRNFVVAVANDPDVRVQEVVDGKMLNLLSIEVKGGTDTSNAYNRGGEAEKSHQSAHSAGYKESWTVINMAGVDVAKLKGGSPTTDIWFETTQVLDQRGDDWDNFARQMSRILDL